MPPPDRHPDHHSHDGHPVTHHHREHAINDNDRPLVNALADVNGVTVPDDDRDVTVADLLDAYVVSFPNADRYDNLRRSASADVNRAFLNVRAALRARDVIATLSPEERAEFDRRTT